MRLSIVAFLAVLILPATALGQDEGAEDPEGRALALFEESVAAYQEGNFDEAIALLTRAYELQPEPVLLYNLGRAQDGAGDFQAAIESYQQYLDEVGDIPDRGAIERRIETLRSTLDERSRLGRLDDVTDAPQEPDSRNRAAEEPQDGGGPSVVPWIVAGVGVVAIGVGAILGGLALGAHDEAVGAPTQEETVAAQDRAEGLALGSTIAFVAGGVIAGAGLVWGIIDLVGSGDDGETTAHLQILPDGIVVRGRF
jgi:tetratricopeptide (TPR) repeat protein